MSFLFGSTKAPSPPEPAPDPTTVNTALIAQQTEAQLRARQGRASTLLSQGQQQQGQAKQLLGS